jgi:hypothetical protein
MLERQPLELGRATKVVHVRARSRPRSPSSGCRQERKDRSLGLVESTMLRIVEVILELIRTVALLVDAIGRHDAALARQFRDALNSALLNTAEASDQRGAPPSNIDVVGVASPRQANSKSEVAVETAARSEAMWIP